MSAFLPIQGPPGLRDMLVSTPGLYGGYIPSPWQVWPAVPLQRTLQAAPPWGVLPSSGNSLLYVRKDVPPPPGPAPRYGQLAGLGALGAALDEPSDERKNALTTMTRGLLEAAEQLGAKTPDYQVITLRQQLEAARGGLMSGARWADGSYLPVFAGGYDSWQANMDRVNRAQGLLLLHQGRGRGGLNPDGTVKQESVAGAFARALPGAVRDEARKQLPALGVGAVALAAGALYLLGRK